MPATLTGRATVPLDRRQACQRRQQDVKQRSVTCKCHLDTHLCLTCTCLALLSLARAQAQNSWVDEVKGDLCRILNQRKKLVTIFKFDDKRRHHGNLEDAILEALLHGDDQFG